LPIPKSSPQENKGVRMKGAILVLTSTPIIERTEAEKSTKVGTENTKGKSLPLLKIVLGNLAIQCSQ